LCRFARPRGARVGQSINTIEKEGKGWRMPSQHRLPEEEETPMRGRKSEEGDANMRSIFKTSRCNTCNTKFDFKTYCRDTWRNLKILSLFESAAYVCRFAILFPSHLVFFLHKKKEKKWITK
jgi:hypothetical protein